MGLGHDGEPLENSRGGFVRSAMAMPGAALRRARSSLAGLVYRRQSSQMELLDGGEIVSETPRSVLLTEAEANCLVAIANDDDVVRQQGGAAVLGTTTTTTATLFKKKEKSGELALKPFKLTRFSDQTSELVVREGKQVLRKPVQLAVRIGVPLVQTVGFFFQGEVDNSVITTTRASVLGFVCWCSS